MSTALQAFLSKVETRDARIGVVGLGYVGLPVAVSLANAGFSVLGIDVRVDRVQAVEGGDSFLRDVPADQVAALRKSGRLRASDSYQGLRSVDAVLVCVPTPLADGAPDLSNVVRAAEGLSRILRPGMLVVLESTTYPGTTEELLKPTLELSGLKAEEDFFLAYSPERIDPGNPFYGFGDIPKVVGGLGSDSTAAAVALYQQAVPKVMTVSGTREAELSKLIENTFRHVNIALVNELAVYAHEMGVDIWEAIEAAATKPFGYLPFWPGPGWGGHCIPLDPTYLSWRVRRDQAHEVRFVELAHSVNAEMPRYVVERATLLLNDCGKPVKGSKVLGIGIAYKPGTEDVRESPAVKVLTTLARRGSDVCFHDPLVDEVSIGFGEQPSTPLSAEELRRRDLVLILTAQEGVDWGLVTREAPLILDCCNALGRKGWNIVRL